MDRKPAVVLILILISMLIIAGCANSNNQDEDFEKNKVTVSKQSQETNIVEADITEKYWRVDYQNGVIAEVLWSAPALYLAIGGTELVTEYELADYHVFDFVFHDHSGFLQHYSILDQVVLLADEKEVKPVKVDILSNDSHHHRLLLKFPITDERGKETITAETNTVTMVLRDLADVPERTLTWQLPLL